MAPAEVRAGPGGVRVHRGRHDSPTAIAEWAADCSRESLLLPRRPPGPADWPGLAAEHADLSGGPSPGLTQTRSTGHFMGSWTSCRPQCRRNCRKPLGKTALAAVRPDGSQGHLLSTYHVTESRVMVQQEVGAKINEIPELLPTREGLDLDGTVVTTDALCRHNASGTNRGLRLSRPRADPGRRPRHRPRPPRQHRPAPRLVTITRSPPSGRLGELPAPRGPWTDHRLGS